MTAPPESDDDLERARVRARVRAGLFGAGAEPTRVAHFEIARRLGAGAMGVVYEAWDPRLRRRLALKMLRTEDGQDRLVREARALAQLRHPNVVSVYDVGSHEGRVYVAMELVEGETLSRWVARTEPGIAARLDLLRRVGEGLAAAHARGLVHRDVKPDNVLVDAEGSPRLVDFGLARLGETDVVTSLAARIPGAADDARLTRTGTVLGTPAYMPPEQLHGREADARSDQYAFCATAYEVLYGQLAFDAGSLAELVEAVVHGAPRDPPRVGEPPEVRRAILRGLSREPDRRFSSMADLLAELRPPAARAPLWPFAIAGALLVLLLAVVAGGGLAAGVLLGREDGAAAPPVASPVPTSASPDAAVALAPRDAGTTTPDAGPPDAGRSHARRRRDPVTRAPDFPRYLLVASTANLYRNDDAMEAAARPLRGAISACFPAGWEASGSATSAFVEIDVAADGAKEDVRVETRWITGDIAACIGRVVRSRLRLPPTDAGRGGTVGYHVPLHRHGY